MIGHRSDHRGIVAGGDGYSLLCCHTSGFAHGTAQVLHMHGCTSNSRTVGQQGNDQEQSHQECAERHTLQSYPHT